MRTPLCDVLGIDLPILSAGMGGGMAGPELVSAVSNAGGFGVLGLLALPPPAVREQIRRTKALTRRPFGANFVLPQLRGGEIDACFDEGVAALVTFWGDPGPLVRDAHRRGMKVIAQVGSVDEAVAAAESAVDAVIAQGVEAGGHVRGATSLSALVPSVVDAVRPLPVIAAGGIADGRGVAAALALGAQAVSIGTRFLASHEAQVRGDYKERLVRARAEDTVVTTLFDGGWPEAPARVLRNRAYQEWEAAGRPEHGKRPGEGSVIGTVALGGQTMDVVRYTVVAPVASFLGDADYACLYAGESVSLVKGVRPAAEIVRELTSALGR
jgi:nitronate monooxygenase/enoyl-[acyl-carrier protein] reductase II